MALRDIFKRKKPVGERLKPAKEEPKQAKAETALPKKKRIVAGKFHKILKAPQVTEKATDLTKENQYAFKVFPDSNKPEIRRAISDLYGVDVLDVKIMKVPAKRRRMGRISGWRKGYKKAVVRLKGGQKIEVLPRWISNFQF